MKYALLIFLIATVLTVASSISIAVLDLEPRGVSEDEAVLITDILRTELLKTERITIVERERINAILKERQLSEVGVTESVELGKILGVDKIVFGRIGKLGDSYIITIRMIDIGTGKVDFAEQYKCEITPESIEGIMKEIAQFIEKYLPPIEGKILLRKGKNLYISLTTKDSIKENMELPVFRVEKVVDEEGNVIFEDKKQIGVIRIQKVSSKGSLAVIIKEKQGIKKGDIVILLPLKPETPITATLEGTVKIHGDIPATKAKVILTGPVEKETSTDENGHFSFKELPAGKYKLSVSKPGYSSISLTINIEKGQKVILEKALIIFPENNFAVLKGRALFEDRTTHEQISIELKPLKDLSLPTMRTTADESGYYYFDRVPPGDYIVYAFEASKNPSYSPDSATIHVEAKKTLLIPELILRRIPSHIVILRDEDPWDTPDAITDILEELGFSKGKDIMKYEIKGSDFISSTPYFKSNWIIIIEGDQPQKFYDTYVSNSQKFDDFVANGGTLIWIASDNGWNEGDFTGKLPGGIVWRDYNDDYNEVVNSFHPLLTGFPTILKGNHASHGGFLNLHSASVQNPVILLREHSSEEGYPTFIEYRYGKGKVFATTQPLEYYKNYGCEDCSTEYFFLLLKRIIKYVFNFPLSN